MITFEGVDGRSPWPDLLSRAWPGRRGAWMHRDNVLPTSLVDRGQDTYEEWLDRRPRRAVKELRRTRRRLEELGGAIRRSTPAQLEEDLAAVCRLHRARWADRGGSANLDAGVEAMLREAVGELLPADRARIWVIEIDGRPISAELMIVAGEEMAAWGGGFEEEWTRLAPGVMALHAAVEHSFSQGGRRFDLGEGGESYKRRMADHDGEVVWSTLFPRSRRYPLTRMRMLPRHFEYWARRRAQRLSPDTRKRIRRALPLSQ
jgi:CelD/BcsL family acetyltransferase involved in cellulose biosynthesis